MADPVPVNWVDIPVVDAAGADDEVLLVNLGLAAAQQVRRLDASVLGIRPFDAVRTLAAEQLLTAAFADIGAGLSLEVSGVLAGRCVLLATTVYIHKVGGGQQSFAVELRRGDVTLATSYRKTVEDVDLENSVTFLHLDEPGAGDWVYSVRAKGNVNSGLSEGRHILVAFRL